MTANPLSTIPPIGPATGMTPPPNAGRFKPIDPVRLARQHFKLLLVAFIIGLTVGVGLYLTLRKTSPQFSSAAQLLVSSTNLNDPFDPSTTNTAATRMDDVVAYMKNEANFIASDEIVRDTLQRPAVQQTAWFRSQPNATVAREQMQEEMLSINDIRGTTLINVAMSAPNPDDARILLDELLATYLNRKKLLNDQAGSSLRRLFISEESRSDDDIRAIRRQMDRFIEENDIKSLNVAASEEQVVFNRLLQQQLELSLELEGARGSLESLRSSTAISDMTDEENAYLKTLPQIASRQEELRQLDETRRALLAGGMQANHPQIKQLDRRRDTVQFELDRVTDKEVGEMRALQLQQANKMVEGLTGQLAGLEMPVTETSNKLKDLTQKLSDYERLSMDLELAMMKKQRADEALDALRTLSNREDNVRVRTQVAPSEPELTSPNLVLVPMVTFLVTGLVAGLVLLREMLDQRVRSPQDLKLLPETNLLGLVPHASEDPTGSSTAERTVENAPTGLLAESYRQIRTSLLSKMDRRGYKTLVCVSAQPEAGTSTVVHNLATSLAFNGRNVLIIDSNFRRPAQHRLMDCGNERGLVDVLKETQDLDDVLVEHPEMSLTVLPTGRAADSPPELLEGPAFRGLLGELETRFDQILIDAPPALLTSDSQLLSKHVDAIAVVVEAGKDKRGMLGRMLAQLDGQRADVLGVILNGVKSSAGGYFRKSYEDFYRYREAGASLNDKRSAKAERKAKGRSRNGRKNGKTAEKTAVGSDELDL
jgi:capsular exopolysaccharide synthesis family protein